MFGRAQFWLKTTFTAIDSFPTSDDIRTRIGDFLVNLFEKISISLRWLKIFVGIEFLSIALSQSIVHQLVD